jgi:hypothetical protein
LSDKCTPTCDTCSGNSTCPTPSWSGEALLVKLEINRGKNITTQKYSIKIEKFTKFGIYPCSDDANKK